MSNHNNRQLSFPEPPPNSRPRGYTISGCTDPNADNYDSYANKDDGSCTFNLSGRQPTLQVYIEKAEAEAAAAAAAEAEAEAGAELVVWG